MFCIRRWTAKARKTWRIRRRNLTPEGFDWEGERIVEVGAHLVDSHLRHAVNSIGSHPLMMTTAHLLPFHLGTMISNSWLSYVILFQVAWNLFQRWRCSDRFPRPPCWKSLQPQRLWRARPVPWLRNTYNRISFTVMLMLVLMMFLEPMLRCANSPDWPTDAGRFSGDVLWMVRGLPVVSQSPAWIRKKNAIIFWDHNMIQRSHWQLMLGPPITFLAILLRSREIGGSLSALLYNQSRHKAMNSRHRRFRRSQKSPKVRSWGTHIGSSNPFPR